MAIAITPFDGFCGFRPLGEIKHFLQSLSPFHAIVGEDIANSFISTVTDPDSTNPDIVKSNKAALRALFSALMHAEPDAVKKHTDDLVAAAKAAPTSFGSKELADLTLRLHDQFPNDIGLFCTFVLNYIKLQPGEAVFLRANDPHAYLSGDIVECMAASDNVVRAGFTPKFKDVKNLTEMLTYSYAPISEQKMKPEPWKKGSNSKTDKPTSLLYDPPIEEFAVVKTELEKGGKETFEAVEGPSIVIFTKGGGKIKVGPKEMEAKEGHVFFVGATAEVEMDGGEEGATAFRAFCELAK